MRNYLLSLCSVLALGAAACGDDDPINSNETARRAYLGLDPSIEKSLQLGFDGFNAASSANIDPQEDVGDDTGSLLITGQADQGESDNKGFRLYVGMVDYSDGEFTVVINEGTDDEQEVTVHLTYDTSETETDRPYLDIDLRNFPDGTLEGTLTGDYFLSGDIEGTVTLDLTFDGLTEDIGNGDVGRVVGSTSVTGTATSGDGLYEVDLTI